MKIYWKKTIPIHPVVTIKVTPLDYFDSQGDKEANQIGQQVLNYLNELKIGEVPSENDLIAQSLWADPQFKGKPTYNVSSVSIGSTSNPLTYYKYTTITVAAGTSTDEGKYIITIN